jgi:hypothetical protein
MSDGKIIEDRGVDDAFRRQLLDERIQGLREGNGLAKGGKQE